MMVTVHPLRYIGMALNWRTGRPFLAICMNYNGNQKRTSMQIAHDYSDPEAMLTTLYAAVIKRDEMLATLGLAEVLEPMPTIDTATLYCQKAARLFIEDRSPLPIVREIKVYVPHEGVVRARGDVRRVLDRYGVKYDREAPYVSA